MFMVHLHLNFAAGDLGMDLVQDVHPVFKLAAGDVGLAQIDQGMVEVRLHLDGQVRNSASASS